MSRDIIPWEWIVDENRELERCATGTILRNYARGIGILSARFLGPAASARRSLDGEGHRARRPQPVLDEYGVGFRVMHGFSSATAVYDVAQGDDGRPSIVLYVGDWDPSGLCMSERDLPKRLEKYDGHHVRLNRIAIVGSQRGGLQSFPAASKRKDPRYRWFTQRYGGSCWELDAMDPNALRACIEAAVRAEIEWEAWNCCEVVNDAERELLREVLESWSGAP